MPVPAAAPGPAVGAVDPDMEMLKLPMEMNDATLYTIRFGGHSTSFLRTVSFSNPVSPMPSSIPPAIPPMPLPSTLGYSSAQWSPLPRFRLRLRRHPRVHRDRNRWRRNSVR